MIDRFYDQFLGVRFDNKGRTILILDVIMRFADQGGTRKSPIQPVNPESFSSFSFITGNDSAHASDKDIIFDHRRRFVRQRPVQVGPK